MYISPHKRILSFALCFSLSLGALLFSGWGEEDAVIGISGPGPVGDSAPAEPDNTALPDQPELSLGDSSQSLGVSIAAMSMTPYDSGVIVTTFEELKSALTDTVAQYSIIYLGANIAISGSIQLPLNRSDVELVGTNPLTKVRHTLIETANNPTDDSSNIYMPNPSAPSQVAMQNFTIRDIDLYGYNYYGPVYFRDDAAMGVTLSFRNVTYTGPQPVVHRTGKVVFDSSRFHILYTGGAPPEELAQAAQVVMERKVTVDVDQQGTDSVVWLEKGAVSPLSFTVAEGAEVIVTNGRQKAANNSFLYSDYNNYPITFGRDSSFTYNGQRGFIYKGYPGDVTLGENARVSITASDTMESRLFEVRGHMDIQSGAELSIVNNTSSIFASLFLESGATLNVREGGSLRIYHSPAGYALRAGTGATTLTFDRPKRVVLLSRDNTPLYFAGNLASPAFRLEADQLNRWTSVPADSGGFLAPPDQHWTKASGTITMTSGGGTSGFQGLSGNYDPAVDPSTELLYEKSAGQPLNGTVFNLSATRVIAFGEAESVEWAEYAPAGPAVSGQVESTPGNVIVQRKQEGQEGYTTWSVDANNPTDSDRSFYAPLSAVSSIPDTMYVQSGSDYLYSLKTPFPTKRLSLQVDDLHFLTTGLAATTRLIPRANSWRLQVGDTSHDGSTGWRLTALVTEQLTGTYGGKAIHLDNVLVNVDSSGNATPLPAGSDPPLTVATGSGPTENLWEDGEGILTRIPTGAAYKTTYRGELEWTLSLAP